MNVIHAVYKLAAILVVILSILTATTICYGQSASETASLPPALPWHGASIEWVVPPGHEWITPVEASDFKQLHAMKKPWRGFAGLSLNRHSWKWFRWAKVLRVEIL